MSKRKRSKEDDIDNRVSKKQKIDDLSDMKEVVIEEDTKSKNLSKLESCAYVLHQDLGYYHTAEEVLGLIQQKDEEGDISLDFNSGMTNKSAISSALSRGYHSRRIFFDKFTISRRKIVKEKPERMEVSIKAPSKYREAVRLSTRVDRRYDTCRYEYCMKAAEGFVDKIKSQRAVFKALESLGCTSSTRNPKRATSCSRILAVIKASVKLGEFALKKKIETEEDVAVAALCSHVYYSNEYEGKYEIGRLRVNSVNLREYYRDGKGFDDIPNHVKYSYYLQKVDSEKEDFQSSSDENEENENESLSSRKIRKKKKKAPGGNEKRINDDEDEDDDM